MIGHHAPRRGVDLLPSLLSMAAVAAPVALAWAWLLSNGRW